MIRVKCATAEIGKLKVCRTCPFDTVRTVENEILIMLPAGFCSVAVVEIKDNEEQ